MECARCSIFVLNYISKIVKPGEFFPDCLDYFQAYFFLYSYKTITIVAFCNIKKPLFYQAVLENIEFFVSLAISKNSLLKAQ